MLKNKVFYKNDVSDKILMVLPRASDKVLNKLKGLPLCELVTFETTPDLLDNLTLRSVTSVDLNVIVREVACEHPV